MIVRRPRPVTRSQSPAPSGSERTVLPNGNGSGRSLSQTRLDRIAAPTATYHQAFFRWFLRLTDDPETYPAAEMKRHLEEELGPELSGLRVTAACPPAGMTGEAWEALEDRLQRLQGKADAIARVLEVRAPPRPAPRTRSFLSKTKETGPLASCGSGVASSTTERDPFEDE